MVMLGLLIVGREETLLRCEYLLARPLTGKPDQWQVHPELNFRALCRLRTSKEPDSQGPWVVNHGLQDVGGKKTWVWEQEDQMSCREVDLLAEELRASAPPIIHQPLTFGKTGPLGLYRKTDQIFNDRPVYYSQKSKLYIFYQKAQVGKRADGTWGALPDRDKMNRWKRYYYVKETCPAISFSSATQGFSPITATWRTRDGEVLKWTCPDPSKCPERKVKDPDEEDLEPVPAGWKDPDFPHESSSCKSSDQDKEFKWLRAYELSRNLSGDFTATLFGEGTEPADACQGAICNCWLMAAISKLAEYPGVIESLFSPKEASLEGKYEIRLCKEFTGGKTEWTVVTIDDYLPCKYGKPIYAKFHKGKMYVALLEKAIAKLMDGDKQRGRLTFEGKGTYASFFSGGMNNFAWSMMTGLYGYTCYGPPHGEDRAQWQALENLAVTTDPSEEETEELGVLGAGATIQEVELWRCYVKFQKMSGEGPEEGWVPSYILGRRVAKRISKFPWHIYVPEPFEGSYDAKPVEEEWVWEKMMEFDKDNSLVDVSLTYRRSSAELKQDGLLGGGDGETTMTGGR
ncbi:unnamed protein product [Durusdinium trenchii]|uniref:Calpain catalytic domain-containing protein n=1 Tax=Durusdinium trenchii TaxID=1381693 RepID=A0ABP0KAD5_9DINO